jgi:hypothetical protein
MTWEQKIDYDLHYIENITFREDFRILMKTVVKVFARDGIATEGMDTAQDLGDYLLDTGRVSKAEYDEKQAEAKELLNI